MFNLDGVTQVVVDSSSKGNQRKFYHNGYWIKLDNQGCSEGLAEDFVSKLCASIYDFPFVAYESSQFEYMDDVYTGCYSPNMYGRRDISFVSFRSLLRQWGVPTNIFFKESSVAQNILNVVQLIRERLHLDLLDYFRRLLLLDSLIINEDRHIMNLGVCYCRTDGRFYEAQCFDNGSSLFCVNWTFRKRKSFEENIAMSRSVARPFSKFYDKQVQALLELGCQPLRISKAGVDTLLSKYHNPLYSDDLNARVKGVLCDRLGYYQNTAFVFV